MEDQYGLKVVHAKAQDKMQYRHAVRDCQTVFGPFPLKDAREALHDALISGHYLSAVVVEWNEAFDKGGVIHPAQAEA